MDKPELKTVMGLTHMRISMPVGERLFIWDCGGESVFPIAAKDRDEAVRKAIALRMREAEGDTPEEKLAEAVRWFDKNDQILEVNCDPLDIPPFEGDLPDSEEEHVSIEN